MNHTDRPKLERTLSIPLPNEIEWEEKPTWCRILLTIHLQESVQKSLAQVWRQVLTMIHNVVGYVRTGIYNSVNYQPVFIKTYIDIFERVDLIEYKSLIQDRLGTKCSMVMESFSFDK